MKIKKHTTITQLIAQNREPRFGHAFNILFGQIRHRRAGDWLDLKIAQGF
jgi:hypothetical protein